jgi:hypothetical protein
VSYSVRRHELEGPTVIARASAKHIHTDMWRAQNEAEKLARDHDSFAFNQELACWQGSDADGKIFRYFAVAV